MSIVHDFWVKLSNLFSIKLWTTVGAHGRHAKHAPPPPKKKSVEIQ